MIDREVRALVASDAFADIWVRFNIRAQQALVRVLEGDATGAVSVQGDQVVQDVSDVIAQSSSVSWRRRDDRGERTDLRGGQAPAANACVSDPAKTACRGLPQPSLPLPVLPPGGVRRHALIASKLDRWAAERDLV